MEFISESDKQKFQSMIMHLEHIYLQLRGVGTLFFVPLIMLYLVVPFIIFIYAKTSTKSLDVIFVNQCNFFIPILSTWWVFLVMKEYVEGDGNEVLYIENHSKLTEVVGLFVCYDILLVVFFTVASVFIGDVAFSLFLQMSVVSFFYCGLAYVFLYLFKSIAIAFLPMICYSLYCSDGLNATISFFNTSTFWTDPLKYMIEMVIAGGVCFLCGNYLNKKSFL